MQSSQLKEETNLEGNMKLKSVSYGATFQILSNALGT
jgi:hypothetical protein